MDKNQNGAKTPYTWKCGTPAWIGDVAMWDDDEKYIGELYWSDYFKSYQVSVGSHLTLNELSIDEFSFIKRGKWKHKE